MSIKLKKYLEGVVGIQRHDTRLHFLARLKLDLLLLLLVGQTRARDNGVVVEVALAANHYRHFGLVLGNGHVALFEFDCGPVNDENVAFYDLLRVSHCKPELVRLGTCLSPFKHISERVDYFKCSIVPFLSNLILFAFTSAWLNC